MDLSVTIAGVKFPTCFMNASGALCVTREELLALGRSQAGAIVTKSMTLEPRGGNPEPRYYGFPGGSINSMGLPNLGYRAYADLIPELARFGKPVIASIAGLCEDDFLTMARAIDQARPDLIEVNLSCPNIPGKPQIAYDPVDSERLLRRVRPLISVPMGVKLPPYFDPAHHAVMADVIRRCGVDYLNLINSVGNGLVIDPQRQTPVIKPKGGFGGLGGAMIKPVALANVRAFWKLLDGRIPIIGTGGVVRGVDAFEHVLCGASAVQVGTALVEEGVAVFDRLEKELVHELTSREFASLEACRGKLREL
ncbi:MAG: Dihydroorotate dehydrogenase A (fumarate) [Nitrospirae bacterium]|nr:MAG: dihydroorotate dehydrogenase [Nitrospira sp. OLB3]MBV6468749.1 Dihydroorotate dehydrogenase A (fumarate) [Nitrospirota bacterium]MCE7964082.1 dihydroorotate oxidase [Nitrospira sp. NTP2]MCK6492727.1 dihydroorotate oxidase [Nitrospira sp.]MEB2337068.1 dihydroorotate oxidase [Nitrospirales bacterium]